MRMVFGIGFAAAVLALTAGCGKKDSTDGGGGGGPSLEGTWLIVGMEMEGEKIPDEFISKGKEEDRMVKITGNQFIGSKGAKEPATYTTDKSKNPAHIDMTGKKGGKDEKMYGIFKLEGDTLTLCMAESDKAEDRPKDFKTEKGGKAMMMTMKKK